MSEINPDQYLLRIQKQKYKIALFPILLVIAGFLLQTRFQIDLLKYISLAGLLGYVFIIMLHRVNKAVPPISEKSIVLAPISGKVTSLNNGSIEITKNAFAPIDLRCASMNDEIDISWKKGKFIFFEQNCRLPGKLIGMVAGRARCNCNFPDHFTVVVKSGDKLIAGESILAASNSRLEF